MKYLGGPYSGQDVPESLERSQTVDVGVLGSSNPMTYRRQGWQLANGRVVHVMVMDGMSEVEAATLAQRLLGD